MSFKIILVPVGSPEASKSTLNAALLIAKRWNSHRNTSRAGRSARAGSLYRRRHGWIHDRGDH